MPGVGKGHEWQLTTFVAAIGAGAIGGVPGPRADRGGERPAPGAETFLRGFVAAAWPSLARLSPLPADPPWAALRFPAEPEAALAGAEFVQESAPERQE